MRTMFGILAIIMLGQTDPLIQKKGSKVETLGSISDKRAEEIKTTLAARFDGLARSEIQMASAIKGTTAVGAIMVETKADLTLVKDPCKSESAKRPIVFEAPYEKKKVGEFVCANEKKFDKMEVEQR